MIVVENFILCEIKSRQFVVSFDINENKIFKGYVYSISFIEQTIQIQAYANK